MRVPDSLRMFIMAAASLKYSTTIREGLQTFGPDNPRPYAYLPDWVIGFIVLHWRDLTGPEVSKMRGIAIDEWYLRKASEARAAQWIEGCENSDEVRIQLGRDLLNAIPEIYEGAAPAPTSAPKGDCHGNEETRQENPGRKEDGGSGA